MNINTVPPEQPATNIPHPIATKKELTRLIRYSDSNIKYKIQKCYTPHPSGFFINCFG